VAPPNLTKEINHIKTSFFAQLKSLQQSHPSQFLVQKKEDQGQHYQPSLQRPLMKTAGAQH